MAKNDHIQEGGKVGRSNVFPVKLFPFDSYLLPYDIKKHGERCQNVASLYHGHGPCEKYHHENQI